MDRLSRLLLLSFVESVATILVERGVYFYSHERMAFNDAANLWLALGIGTFYVGGAMLSHRLALRLGERRLLTLLLIGHFASHTLLAALPMVVPFVAVNLALAGLTGAKWPLIESYISAGRNARDTASAVGKFNIAWSMAAPVAMAAAGPLIAMRGGWPLFGAAALVNLGSLWLVRPLEPRPVHLPPDHPERLPDQTLAGYRRLLVSHRFSMLASYTLLFLLVPLMPRIFEDLGFKVAAPALASLVEVVRAGAFLTMFVLVGWHGRRSLAVWAAIGLPVGFFAVLWGQSLGVVLLGELIFGAAAGAAYYGALYYAMVVANASVESGGAHESLVGGGFALGPMLGLMGLGVATLLGGPTAGMMVVLGPAIAFGLFGSLWPLRRR